jgi:predicted nucleic acid-binding Zn ribbon protein
MPNYTFQDTNTGDIQEVFMRISELTEFKESNPHLKQLITGAPALAGSVSLRDKRPDGFKEVMSRVAEANPTSQVAADYGRKSAKQIKTEQIIEKHRKIQKGDTK